MATRTHHFNTIVSNFGTVSNPQGTNSKFTIGPPKLSSCCATTLNRRSALTTPKPKLRSMEIGIGALCSTSQWVESLPVCISVVSALSLHFRIGDTARDSRLDFDFRANLAKISSIRWVSVRNFRLILIILEWNVKRISSEELDGFCRQLETECPCNMLPCSSGSYIGWDMYDTCLPCNSGGSFTNTMLPYLWLLLHTLSICFCLLACVHSFFTAS